MVKIIETEDKFVVTLNNLTYCRCDTKKQAETEKATLLRSLRYGR